MAKNDLMWKEDSEIKAYQQAREKTFSEYVGLIPKKEAQERVFCINSHIAARFGRISTSSR